MTDTAARDALIDGCFLPDTLSRDAYWPAGSGPAHTWWQMALTTSVPPLTHPRKIVASRASADWLVPLVEKATAVANLPDGWDGYGGRPLDADAAVTGIQILVDAGFDGPGPWLSPTPDGGLHLEWEYSNVAFELEVDPAGVVTVLVDDGDGDIDEIFLDRAGAGDHLRSLLIAEATVATTH